MTWGGEVLRSQYAGVVNETVSYQMRKRAKEPIGVHAARYQHRPQPSPVNRPSIALRSPRIFTCWLLSVVKHLRSETFIC